MTFEEFKKRALCAQIAFLNDDKEPSDKELEKFKKMNEEELDKAFEKILLGLTIIFNAKNPNVVEKIKEMSEQV